MHKESQKKIQLLESKIRKRETVTANEESKLFQERTEAALKDKEWEIQKITQELEKQRDKAKNAKNLNAMLIKQIAELQIEKGS